MSTVIYCPDCGGVVGARETTDAGPPCTCFVEDKPGPGDTDIADAPVEAAVKTCVQCGKDLTGHKRLKDSHGYWCKDCHRADVAEKAPKGVPCPVCKRVVKEESFISVDGHKMCSRCARAKRELKKAGSKKYRQIDTAHFEKENKTTLWVLLGVIILLALFMLYGMLRG